MKALFFILLFTTSLSAQSISVSLPSFEFWGESKMISEVSVEYNDIGLHYFHSFTPKKPYMTDNNQSALGLSYSPLEWKFAKLGIIATNKPFPTERSIQANFLLDFGFSISKVSLSYRHISNGFGLIHPINNGYDAITITVQF